MSGRCSSTVKRECGLATTRESSCSVPRTIERTLRASFIPLVQSQEIRNVKLPAVAGAAARYTAQDGVSGGMVRALLQSSDGHVWIATLDGVTQFDGERFRAFTKAQGVPGATSLAEDRHGNVWIGTAAGGALRLARNGFTSYTEADGLAATPIRAVLQSPAGELHVVSVEPAYPSVRRDAVYSGSGESVRRRWCRQFWRGASRSRGRVVDTRRGGTVPVPKSGEPGAPGTGFDPKRSTRRATDWRVMT